MQIASNKIPHHGEEVPSEFHFSAANFPVSFFFIDWFCAKNFSVIMPNKSKIFEIVAICSTDPAIVAFFLLGPADQFPLIFDRWLPVQNVVLKCEMLIYFLNVMWGRFV